MSEPGKIDLLVADVDGTLVTDDKRLTPRAIDAVGRLGAAGIGFTITSSRPPRGLAGFVKPLDLKLPIGGFNGGGLVRPDLSSIQKLNLEEAIAREAAAIAGDHGLDVWLYTDDAWFVRNAAAPRVARETFTLGFPPTVVADFESVWCDVGKLVAVGDDPQAVARCNTALDGTLTGCVSATRSQDYLIDITNCEANKGELVLTLSKLLNIPTARIATIGDGQNDVLMFARGGLSIAMGNADPTVKSKAKLVTNSNNDDGFAKAVERFILGENS